jgi:hypothetical protein
MKNQRGFSVEFKRDALEESGKASLPNGNTIFAPVCFTTGRTCTPGGGLTMSLPSMPPDEITLLLVDIEVSPLGGTYPHVFAGII